MKLLRLFALLFVPALSFAQFTTVTGTVIDPNGLAYAGGTISPTLTTSASPTLNGLPYTPPTQPTGLDINGKFTMRLADNTVLLPASTKWNFVVCSGTGTVNPAIGKGPVCFTLASPITISGSSQSISTQLQAAALALTNNPGTGTVSSVACTAPLVCAPSPIVATGTASCPTCAIGPGSSTANHVAEFASTDGVTLQDGGPLSASFSALTSGTNTTAAMLVGTGASLGSTGTGTVNATNGAVPAFPVLAQGAKCDGSTDDTTAIQAALTACAGSANGGTVIVPAGNCRISSALTHNGSGCTLQGQGSQVLTSTGSTIETTSATANIINMGATSGTANQVRIKDLALQRTVAPSGSSIGLNISSCSTCDVDNVNLWDGGITGVSVTTGTGGTIDRLNHMLIYNTLGNTTYGLFLSGNENSLYTSWTACGSVTFAVTYCYYVAGGTNDVFMYHPESAAGATHGLYFAGNANDINVVQGTFDTCTNDCVSVNSSTGGGLGNDNSITLTDVWSAPNSSATAGIIITSSQGVQINGGTAMIWHSGANAVIANSSSRLQINNVHAFVRAGTNTSNCFAFVTTTDSTLSGNHCFGLSGTPFLNAYTLITSSVRNTIGTNTASGSGSSGLNFDSTSTGNLVTGFVPNLASITNSIVDAAGGNSYSSSLLASGINGDAFSYKATSTITASKPVPVKWDTSNANQVVQTTTTDTGGGIPIGVCPNSPTAGNSCLLMTHGTVPLTLGTGTCSIANFAIVDTTTNGDTQCTGTYTAGTVIGTAQAANSTVGTTSNVMIGLR
jgi:hypothetical protein